MLWLVWVIAVPVVLVVAGVVVGERWRSGRWPEELELVVGCTAFGSSLLGCFVTAMASPTLATWWQAPLVRAIWQIGGAVVLCVCTWHFAADNGAQRSPAIRFLLGAALLAGLALGFNPVLDLLSGPQLLRGVSEINVTHSHGPGAKIWANFKAKDASGSTHEVDLTGWSANDALERLERCEGASELDVVVLLHLDRVLDVRCK